MVQNTGSVIEPYQRYPKLLSIMLARLQAEQVFFFVVALSLETSGPEVYAP